MAEDERVKQIWCDILGREITDWKARPGRDFRPRWQRLTVRDKLRAWLRGVRW